MQGLHVFSHQEWAPDSTVVTQPYSVITKREYHATLPTPVSLLLFFLGIDHIDLGVDFNVSERMLHFPVPTVSVSEFGPNHFFFF